MKKNKKENEFLEQLKKVPIVQVSCDMVNISRNSVYKWKKQDAKFSKAMDEALVEGENFINDMGEAQLLNLIKEKSWPALAFWLKHRNPKFRERVEITNVTEDDHLSPEQEAQVKKALELGSIIKTNNKK
jgi:hypothetical protein